MKKTTARFALTLFVCILCTRQLQADEPRTLRFQQGASGYHGTQDVVINSFSPDESDNGPSLKNDIADNGPENFLEALIRFDKIIGAGLLQIPAGAKIVSARLRLTVYNGGSGIVVHRVQEPWDEKSTWKSLGRGVDKFVATPDDRKGRGNHRKNVRKGTIDLNVTASLAAWVENRQPNYGWVLRAPMPGGTNSLGIHSNEAEQPDGRPLLIVKVSPPAK